MRLSNKLNQLVMGASGKPRIFDIEYVQLKKDGSISGRLPTGERVYAKKYTSNCVWRLCNV